MTGGIEVPFSPEKENDLFETVRCTQASQLVVIGFGSPLIRR
jgi:hypothetical protein